MTAKGGGGQAGDFPAFFPGMDEARCLQGPALGSVLGQLGQEVCALAQSLGWGWGDQGHPAWRRTLILVLPGGLWSHLCGGGWNGYHIVWSNKRNDPKRDSELGSLIVSLPVRPLATVQPYRASVGKIMPSSYVVRKAK